MSERRNTKRVTINAPVAISVEERVVKTLMIDFSNDGALFKIDTVDEEKISRMDLGKEATVVLKIKSGPDREYTGEIIRFYNRNKEKYIVLRFWTKYRELPS